jgi:hypothetical protein
MSVKDNQKKLCPQCKEMRSLTDFYKTRKWYQTLCKVHHNKARHKNYVPKKKGFAKLDEKLQLLIKADAKKMNLNQLTRTYNLKYGSVRKWRIKGLI